MIQMSGVRRFASGREALVILMLILVTAVLAVFGMRKSSTPSECVARGAIDLPVTTEMVGSRGIIAGWAYDANGVREIQVLSAERVLASKRPDVIRRDVSAALEHCGDIGHPGFTIDVPGGEVPMPTGVFYVRAVKESGEAYSLGEVSFRHPSVLGILDTSAPIQWNGRNVLIGWAFGQGGAVKVSVRANGAEIASGLAELQRDDVGRAFPASPQAARSGFEIPLSMATLPRGRYRLTLLLTNSDHTVRIEGPEVHNDLPLGAVLTKEERLVNPETVRLNAWVFDEDGIEESRVETETGRVLGKMMALGSSTTLRRFARLRGNGKEMSQTAEHIGNGFAFELSGKALPDGLHRLVVRAVDKSGRESVLPGPLVLVGPRTAVTCLGERRRVFLPGIREVFRTGFPQMESFRKMLGQGCVEVGIRGRLEYLRTTKGSEHDYLFDPGFPATIPGFDKKGAAGESLHELLTAALHLKAPLLITLDGGVWADSRFPMPEFDAVDMLEEDARTVQWNQFGRAEPDDALKGLAGSMDNPQLARMMSLNRFNERFLAYKKRNLQAAVREIVAFSRRHPEIQVHVNLDPDQYINPWFYLTQWYDYNPDALRQFREWLFHQGPYANGGEMAEERFRGAMTLEEASRLAGVRFASIDDVEPPRGMIDYGDSWQQIWTQFKRHLVAWHYEDLARWAVAAGLPADRVHTSQTFIQADVAVATDDRATGWTDQAGVSIAGAKPRYGHLGAILYGPASRNENKPRSGLTLIDNIRRIDPRWGLVEFHPATIAFPTTLPSHEESYWTMLAAIDGGARFFSPMWGSVARDQTLRPERFRSYDAMDGTAFEFQFAWWMKALQALPAGSMLFPFGNEMVESADGWRGGDGTAMATKKGKLVLTGSQREILSPAWDGVSADWPIMVELRGYWEGCRPEVAFDFSNGKRLSCIPAETDPSRARCSVAAQAGLLLSGIRLSWTSPQSCDGVVELDSVFLQMMH